jgi:hypothetical protein
VIRAASQAQRHWSAGSNQALQLRHQDPQAIERGEGDRPAKQWFAPSSAVGFSASVCAHSFEWNFARRIE